MLSLFNNGMIFYILIIICIGNVHGLCNKTLDLADCAYNVYCDDNIMLRYPDMMNNIVDNMNDLNNFRFDGPRDYGDISMYGNENEYDDDGIRITRRRCNFINYEHYSGGRYYPVHVTYRSRLPSLSLEKIRYTTNILITQLNLCDNGYEFIPSIHEMNNLVQLNVSKNSLTVAELSNTVDLPKLTEIDLSHNTINDIKYESGHIYRYLKKIDLSYNYLTKIPEAVFDPFNELETLDVSHNYIEILSPITFEGMKQLKHLNISFNRISDINSSLFRFIELKLLDISNNNIEAIKATDFSKLTNLEVLDLNSNIISIIDKNSFNNMAFLRNLYMNNNKLNKVDNELLSNISSIESVDLSQNVFNKIPISLFKGKNIKHFSIINNQLQGSLEKGMFVGLDVNTLDLSNQHLDSVNDYAFGGTVNLAELLLNNNNISILTASSFKTLRRLKRLDLSFNKIQSIEFKKDDLYNLFSLSLRKNSLTVVKQENFLGLNSLQFLDLSDNKITQVESNSFVSLGELINFQISNNPLSGTLEESTFDGLNSLPSLDISCSLLSSVQNGSFVGMVQLKNLNVSHSKINTLEYNIFVHTGAIDTIDLSFNELKDFNINSTELASLRTLYLNNNYIKMLDPSTFENIISLSKVGLSNNMIKNIDSDVFVHQKYLRFLDVSYNSNFNVTLSLLNATKTLEVLDLSGIKTTISFGNIKDMYLTHLVISNASVTDIKKMQFNELRHLDDMNLSYNNVSKLEVGSFDNITTLRFLDISHNKIKDIQPGVFRDNTMLVSLNVSHNFLTALSYGIFRGLIYLSTLDISYNHISDLQKERFYEVNGLSVLIADHNKIELINAEEFIGTSLTELSIGGNPIPCEVLVNLKRNGVPFEITANKLYENNDENVNGVTCNRKLHKLDRIANVSNLDATDNVKVLVSIRDIILDHFRKEPTSKPTAFDEKYFVNFTDQIKTLYVNVGKRMSDLINSTIDAQQQHLQSTIDIVAKNNETNTLLNKMYTAAGNNETNVLLNKILRVLTLNSVTKSPPIKVNKDNATYENLFSYINKIKEELQDTFKVDKDTILDEIDAKIEAKVSAVNADLKQNNILLSTESPKHEKLSVSDDSKSFFTEICVALILVILVGFVLFKIYKSGVFVRRRFSVSTRELPGSMDSPL